MKAPIATGLGLERLKFSFTRPPLLVGGKAMEYYDLRPAGADVDLIADPADVLSLIALHPTRVKDLWGDLGVCPLEFEIWATICLLTYDDLSPGAIDRGDHLVISLEKLLLMKALATHVEKYLQDTRLIAQRFLRTQYEAYAATTARNAALLAGIPGLTYLERTGPTT
ncbi:MAG TPA: hypothetical protein VFN74_21115 [Chloroflexota bacterium]|nr:hypothetical protein [Chloroflexota bacterium]